MYTPGNSLKFNAVCKALATIGIDNFTFFTQFDDGHQFKWTNRPDMTERFIKENWHEISVFTKHPKEYTPGFYWAASIEHPTIVETFINEYNAHNSIAWINPSDDAVEVAMFSTSDPKPEMINFYLNHMDTLKRFIMFFKNELMEELNDPQERLFIEPCFDTNPTTPPSSCTPEQLAKFHEAIRIKKFYLGAKFNNEHLTTKELEVLRWLTTELTVQEIAEKMHNSPRTIEQHVSNLRSKLQIQKRSDLAQFAQRHLLV